MWEYIAHEHTVWIGIHVLILNNTFAEEIAFISSITPTLEITAHFFSDYEVGSFLSVDGEAPFEAGVPGKGRVLIIVGFNRVHLLEIAVCVLLPCLSSGR